MWKEGGLFLLPYPLKTMKKLRSTVLINFKSRLTKKDKQKVWDIVQALPDYYGDFYITKDNLRLHIKENIELLFKGLVKGDKIAFGKEGLVVVTGFSDKNPRKYIKFLTKNPSAADDLLKILSWNLECDFWCKIKKNNPIKNILKRNGFVFYADRGREWLVVRKYIKRDNKNSLIISKKGEENVKRT